MKKSDKKSKDIKGATRAERIASKIMVATLVSYGAKGLAKYRAKPAPIKHKLMKRLAFVTIFGLAATGMWYQLTQAVPHTPQSDSLAFSVKADITKDFAALDIKIKDFENKEAQNGIYVIDDATVQQEISSVNLNGSLGNLRASRHALLKLASDLDTWNSQLTTAINNNSKQTSTPAKVLTPVPQGLNIPILIYHKTPADFRNQLVYLKQHNYTTINMDMVANAITNKASLPAKPVVITYDDGFADQMTAFALLKQFNMKATFYIIDGGPRSNYCIGANRTNMSCGDAYMSWDQIRQLDQSGLIEIASHTVDHPHLPSLSVADQSYEIIHGKQELEAQLGHSVRHFAYPYGAYDANTIRIVKEAGFTTAVSTIPGTYQGSNNLYALYRIRDPYKLP